LGCWPSISRWPHVSSGVIGALGEAVEAGVLQRRVGVFCLKSTLGGLQPLPRVATRRRRRDTSIMTYPMSWLKRAVLPRWEVASTVWYWWHDDVSSNRLFFWWERAEAEAQNTPCRCNRRCRACREGSWEGGGVLLEQTTVSCLVEDMTCQTMGNCTIVSAIYPILRGLA